ncbi:uncharacterized protein ARMOST_11266 [Armillaria ostoyae]|uniref:BTB domain-containing protein n=1 Tax=Armillaria ostoyae TaxID=47428 RepID=A0A284RGN7_ARMOS|nr:uncharacterized protein ARMOST_11266 [Armillaria ostoyae]
MDNSYSFDGSDTTADVILISCDNIRLYAHKFILSLASPFFKDMFALAQAPTDGTLPLVPMAEDGETIGQILRFCYPIKDPSFGEISALYRVMVVMARKYLMEDLVIRARSELRNSPTLNPCASLPLPKDDNDILELDLLQSPRIIYRLLKFREKRLDKALNNAFIVPDEVRISFQSKPSCSAHSLYQYDGEDGPSLYSIPQISWLLCYATSIHAAIRNRPTWEAVRTVESHLRYEAKDTAWTCPECNICDLPSLFDRFIPEVYLERIQRALSRKFCL